MLVLHPRTAAMFPVHLMMMAQLFRFLYAKPPNTTTEVIQHLTKKLGCELPVTCLERDHQGMCCYDCSGCTDAVCSNHVQCCHNTDFGYYRDFDPDADSGDLDFPDFGDDTEYPDYTDYDGSDNDYASDYSVDYGDRRRRGVNGGHRDHDGGGDDGGGGGDDGNDGESGGSDDGVNAECIELFTKTNIPTGLPERLLYEMIAACPRDAPHQLKELCLNDEDGSVIDHIPVLDPVSNMRYRNRHCLICNVGTNVTGKYSTLVLTRRPQHYYNPFMSLNIDLKSDFSVFNISRIQTRDTLILSATPRFSSTKTTLKLCDQTDDMWECTNSAAPKAYSYACELYGSDWIMGIGIKVRDTSTNQTYLAKNVACAFCALGDRMAIADVTSNGRKRCLLTHQVEPWLVMNPLLLTDEVDTHNGTLSISHNVSNNDMGSCGPGYIYDKVNTTCRKILCHRHHFIYQGQCHPIFTHSIGQSYYIKVNVPIQRDDDDFYTEFGQAVVDAILQNSSFFPCDLKGTLKYDSNNNVTAVILEIFFSATDGTLYEDVIDMITPLFRSDHFKFTFDGLEYRIYPADDVVFSKDEPGRLMNYNHDDVLELRSKTNDELRFTKTRHCHKPIALTGMDFCFRVLLKATDVSDQLKQVHEDYKEHIDADTVAVCIDKYYRNVGNGGDYSNNGTNSTDGESPTDPVNSGDDNSPSDGDNTGDQSDARDKTGDDGNIPKDDDKTTDTNPNVKSDQNNLPDTEDDIGVIDMVLISVAAGALVLFFIVVVVCRKKHNEVGESDEGKNIVDTIGTHNEGIEKTRVK